MIFWIISLCKEINPVLWKIHTIKEIDVPLFSVIIMENHSRSYETQLLWNRFKKEYCKNPNIIIGKIDCTLNPSFCKKLNLNQNDLPAFYTSNNNVTNQINIKPEIENFQYIADNLIEQATNLTLQSLPSKLTHFPSFVFEVNSLNNLTFLHFLKKQIQLANQPSSYYITLSNNSISYQHLNIKSHNNNHFDNKNFNNKNIDNKNNFESKNFENNNDEKKQESDFQNILNPNLISITVFINETVQENYLYDYENSISDFIKKYSSSIMLQWKLYDIYQYNRPFVIFAAENKFGFDLFRKAANKYKYDFVWGNARTAGLWQVLKVFHISQDEFPVLIFVNTTNNTFYKASNLKNLESIDFFFQTYWFNRNVNANINQIVSPQHFMIHDISNDASKFIKKIYFGVGTIIILMVLLSLVWHRKLFNNKFERIKIEQKKHQAHKFD